MTLGVQISGLSAWFLWRTIYLAKLPRFEKKLRVALDWTLDLFFPKNFVQILTLRGIDQIARRLAYVRRHPTTFVLAKSDALTGSRPLEHSPAVPDAEGATDQRLNGKSSVKLEAIV